MNIYLAARYSRYPEMQGYAQQLRDAGHTVTSRWITGQHSTPPVGVEENSVEHLAWAAKEDFRDVLDADCLISFTEDANGDAKGRGRGGRHVEFGYAYSCCLRLIVIGYRENIFHCLAPVEFYATWEECLADLGGTP